MKRLTLRFGSEHARRPVWIGGFNLLPHRQLAARRERRRRVVELLAALAAGCIAVLVLATWQTVDRVRADAQRAALERSLAQLAGPLAEHKRFSLDAADARARTAHAATLSEPLAHLLALLDEISREPDEKIIMQQLRQREHETELLALAHDHAAPASWVKRLATLHGVKDAEVKDLHRTPAPARSALQTASSAIEFSARLYWSGVHEPAVHASAPAVARPVQGTNLRGFK